MKLFQLHKIIESLTDEDVNLVRKALSVKGKKSKYVILLDALRGTEEFSEDVENTLKAKHFSRSDSLYRAKEKVLENIIQVYAKSGEGVEIGIDLVRAAFHLEAFETGKKLLLKGIKSAQENRHIPSLLKFHEFIYQLRDHYQVKMELPSELITNQRVLLGATIDEELKNLIKSVRSAIRLPAIDRERIGKSILSRLREFEQIWIPNPIEILRVKLRAFMLLGSFEIAREFQIEVVGSVRSSRPHFAGQLQELELLMRLNMFTGFRKEAIDILWEMASLSPSSLLDRRIQAKSHLKNAIFMAFYNFSDDLINSSWECFLENQSYFARGKQPMIIYLCSYLFLAIERFEKAGKVLLKLNDFTRSELAHLSWQVPLLRLVIAFESDQLEILDSLVRSSETKARESGLELPKLTTSFIRKCSMSPVSSDLIAEKFLDKVNRSMGTKDEEIAKDFFNLEAFLISKKRNTSMAEIESEMKRHGSQQYFMDWA